MKIKQLEEGLKALDARVAKLEKSNDNATEITLEGIVKQLQHLALEIQLLKIPSKPWYKFW